MTKMKISECKLGDYVQLKEDGPMYVRGAYDRASKTYSLSKCDDMNKEVFRKGSVLVVVGATY